MSSEPGQDGLERRPVGASSRALQVALKRFLDIALCLAVLMFAWPALVLIAILVGLSSRGSIFFVQERVGLGQKPFAMYKFRTMVGTGSREQSTVWTVDEEARITPLGRFLRDYGLDELPQLLNILRGEMSIVGPRPPLPAQAEGYTERQRKMFAMRPGVLSLPAIQGRRSISVEHRLELHVQYVEAWSLGLDLKILWGALFVVLGRRDATEVIVQ